MSEPSYDGLRLALIDGALSLKRSDNFTGDPNIHGQLAIESIVVDDAKYLGRGQSLSCQLNPGSTLLLVDEALGNRLRWNSCGLLLNGREKSQEP